MGLSEVRRDHSKVAPILSEYSRKARTAAARHFLELNDTSLPPSSNRLLRDRITMALLIGVAAWLSLNIARLPGEVAAVWVGNGIFVGWLLSRPTPAWPGYLVAGFAAEITARLLSADSVRFGVALASFNMLEVIIVAGVVRRMVPEIRSPKRWLGLGNIATSRDRKSVV